MELEIAEHDSRTSFRGPFIVEVQLPMKNIQGARLGRI